MTIIRRKPSLFDLERRYPIRVRHVILIVVLVYAICMSYFIAVQQEQKQQLLLRSQVPGDIQEPIGQNEFVIVTSNTLSSKDNRVRNNNNNNNGVGSVVMMNSKAISSERKKEVDKLELVEKKRTNNVVRMEVSTKGIDKIEKVNRHVKVPSNRNQSLWIPEYMSPVDIPNRPSITDLIYVTEDGKSSHVHENADVSWLLDYALIGMAKTGTTSLLRYADPTLAREERCDLVVDDVAVMVNSLYRHYSPIRKNNGFKCPQDITSSLHKYATYFPKTKLIVGIRHPIRWFESLYNYRLTQTSQIAPTHKLTKRCISGSKGICAWRAHIADFLSVMSKTPLQTEHEKSLLPLNLEPIPPTQTVGPVFLYDMQQLISAPQALQQDLQQFLQIPTSNRHIPHLNKNKAAPRQRQIDICNDEHIPIRQALLEIARTSSIWIRSYFLKSPDVYVSNKQQLIDILQNEWMIDPCTHDNVNQ